VEKNSFFSENDSRTWSAKINTQVKHEKELFHRYLSWKWCW
jgi:hypothetical protein